MLVNETSCLPIPCRRGRLYFPNEKTCYKIGSRGPCSRGQIVIYDYSARPSVDGISYNGVCGCTSSLKNSKRCLDNNVASVAVTAATAVDAVHDSNECEDKPGMVLMNDRVCYKLYTKGPCDEGEWLVARRVPKTEESFFWTINNEKLQRQLPKARCECKPGYTRTNAEEIESNNLLIFGKCQPPAVGIAKFLNDNVRSVKFSRR